MEWDWQQLIDEVRAETERGTDPASDRVKELAARWQELVRAFTGDNPDIDHSLQRMWQQETTIHGFDTSEMPARRVHRPGVALGPGEVTFARDRLAAIGE